MIEEPAPAPASPGASSPDFKLTFLVREHEYLQDLIKFSDQKAAFIFALSVGLLTLGHDFHLYDGISGKPLAWAAENSLAALGLILILVSAALSFATLLPRFSSDKTTGLVYFSHVMQHKSANDYATAVAQIDASELLGQVSDHCFSLSSIAHQKFVYTSRSLWIGAIGGLLTAVSITWSPPRPATTATALEPLDRAGVAIIAGLDVERPSQDLLGAVEHFGVEFHACDSAHLTNAQKLVFRSFEVAYPSVLELVKTTSRDQAGQRPPAGAHHPAVAGQAKLDSVVTVEALTKKRQEARALLEEAHRKFTEAKDGQ